MRFEDNTRRTFTGRVAGATWYKNLKRVYVTLDIQRTGSSTRRKAEASARRISETNDFPDWKCKTIEKLDGHPNICLVIGHVQ